MTQTVSLHDLLSGPREIGGSCPSERLSDPVASDVAASHEKMLSLDSVPVKDRQVQPDSEGPFWVDQETRPSDNPLAQDYSLSNKRRLCVLTPFIGCIEQFLPGRGLK
jgi:hypothetical protein